MRGYNIHLSFKETASLYVSLITCLLLGEIRKIHLQKTKFWYFGETIGFWGGGVEALEVG